MAAEKSYLFVSYAREDLDRVRVFLERVRDELKFRALPVDLWVDVSNLTPGQNWDLAIADALRSSIGFLFLVSPRSLNSEWVRRELSAAASSSDRLIIPVLLHRPIELPPALAARQWLDLSGHPTLEEITAAATQIAEVTESYLRTRPQWKAAVTETEAPALAADLANQVRASGEPTPSETQPTSVFVVQGHSTEALAKLEEHLGSVGVAAVVLSRLNESPQSLFQKFMLVATKARFAIVLLSADDYGASRIQYETTNVADRALQFRSRQNVILELGFFYGRLGFENVFVLFHEPDRVFPNFERPSDLDGVIFDSMSSRAWQRSLDAKLSAAGFKLLPST